jgi:hypothetical protein
MGVVARRTQEIETRLPPPCSWPARFCGRADRRGDARTGNSDPGYVNTNPVVVERPSNFELVDGATVPDILKPGELADNTLD